VKERGKSLPLTSKTFCVRLFVTLLSLRQKNALDNFIKEYFEMVKVTIAKRPTSSFCKSSIHSDQPIFKEGHELSLLHKNRRWIRIINVENVRNFFVQSKCHRFLNRMVSTSPHHLEKFLSMPFYKMLMHSSRQRL
jgi:hypothetical protein